MLANLKYKPTKARLYVRVSTKKQGASGLGQAAQIRTATAKAKDMGLEVIETCKEVESGRRTTLRRPVLREALENCATDGAVLIIAKMDRLTRNFAFLQWILEYTERHGVAVVACDIPELADADNTKFLWRILASVADLEVANTRKRTRLALAEAKARKVPLGNPHIREQSAKGSRAMKKHSKEHALRIIPIIDEIEAAGIHSYRGIATALMNRGVKTYGAEKQDAGGKGKADTAPVRRQVTASMSAFEKAKVSCSTGVWHPQAVKNVLAHRPINRH